MKGVSLSSGRGRPSRDLLACRARQDPGAAHPAIPHASSGQIHAAERALVRMIQTTSKRAQVRLKGRIGSEEAQDVT
jgi:hypothetical protein